MRSFDPLEADKKKIDDTVMGSLTDSVSFYASAQFPATFFRLQALNCMPRSVLPLNKEQGCKINLLYCFVA